MYLFRTKDTISDASGLRTVEKRFVFNIGTWGKGHQQLEFIKLYLEKQNNDS